MKETDKPDSSRIHLLYGGRYVLPHMLSEAAFHLAVDAAETDTVSFLCLQKSRLWVRRLVLLHNVAERLGSTLICTHNPFPALEAGGEDRLRDLVREQAPDLVVIDNLGKLKRAQTDQVDLQAADEADREALAQIRAAVKGVAVEVVVVHHVDDRYAYELLREGHVDEVEQALTPASPWMRPKVSPRPARPRHDGRGSPPRISDRSRNGPPSHSCRWPLGTPAPPGSPPAGVPRGHFFKLIFKLILPCRSALGVAFRGSASRPWGFGTAWFHDMKKLRPIVAKAITSMRDASGLSQADVATLTSGAGWPFENITLRRLMRFEHGQSFPSLPSLASLLVAYSPDQATLNFGWFQSYLEESARDEQSLQSLFVVPSENPKAELIMMKLADLESRLRQVELALVSDALGWDKPR